jgi:hypothetical protein
MIALPGISEIELDEQIYSLVAGSVSPRRDSTMLRLRFRSFNESRSEKVLDLIAMRLVVGDALLLPATSLAGRLPARTVLPGDVRFVIPRGTARAVRRVSDGDETGEMELDFAPGGPLVATTEAAVDESRAVGYSVDYPAPPILLEDGDVQYMLLRIAVRQFSNKLRIAVTAKLANESPYPEAFGASTFRLALEDGTVLAPEAGDDDVIAGSAAGIVQVIFEVPVATATVILRTLREDRVTELPVDLRASANPG